MYEKDTLSALEAITEAQRIAFAPMLFKPPSVCVTLAWLAWLDKQGAHGATVDEIVANSTLSEYGAGVLLDMGLSGRIVTHREGRYYLAKIGHYLLHDSMTRINMDFTQDVCYQGLFHLAESLSTAKPAGLSVFGEWPTIYPALSALPEQAQRSWFAFDHFYSDGAFDAALPLIFASSPTKLYDVGGNTGKWALRCCRYDEKYHRDAARSAAANCTGPGKILQMQDYLIVLRSILSICLATLFCRVTLISGG
ncbi:Uncharacterised protein [Leclercia adecarboxylata]|uniref:BVU-1015-like N-terminal dimerisation-like domain-containing protein n=1 Tax=Leclercia adecarboxylata TaxID=83655 RepID=A0A4V6JM04_9ENTR|nr:Uncharacterised protein [Leclercia adecarboxylata]